MPLLPRIYSPTPAMARDLRTLRPDIAAIVLKSLKDAARDGLTEWAAVEQLKTRLTSVCGDRAPRRLQNPGLFGDAIGKFRREFGT